MRVGIAGIGAIGSRVAHALDRQEVVGCELVAIAVRNQDRGAEFNATLQKKVACLSFNELAETCDLVLECLPPQLFDHVALPVLGAGKTLLALSASQLLGRDEVES